MSEYGHDGTEERLAFAWPRDAAGRFLSRDCPDRNCGGRMQTERDGWWRCDGLTHDTDTGPLRACNETIPPLRIQRMESQRG